MNRGSSPALSGPATRRMRFNEAPIHESGKSSRATSGASKSPGFNEAPIHESGKWLRGRTWPRRTHRLQ